MKIATWNIERLKHHRELDEIILACEAAHADILILTETDTRVKTSHPFVYHTPLLSEIQPTYYKPTENRVSVFSKYPCVRQYETYDPYTALCIELETDKGNLLIYGTIMGIFGNRNANFRVDLMKQIEDFKRLSAAGNNLCIAGDYNLSFLDSYYYTKDGRKAVLECFEQIGVEILTAAQPWCIDHIAVSKHFIGGAAVEVKEWNLDKRLSDHKGIMVDCLW